MVRLKDIAKAAGVSAGTVSFVLNNTHQERRISPATVKKVRAIARELGYLPNIAARNLRSSDPVNRQIVLAIITSSESPLTLVGHLLESLKIKMHQNPALDFLINIAMFKPGELHALPGLLDGQRFNAAIITNTTKKDDAFLEKSVLPYPSLLVGREIPNYCCFVPSRNAGKVAFNALKKVGSRKPVVIHPQELTQATEKRVNQFTALAEKEFGEMPQRIICGDLSENAATRSMTNYLKKGGTLDGLFAVHDALAAGAYLAFRSLGLSIPGDVKVIGIGDSEWAPYLDPPLSCAGAEENSVYEKAVDLILSRLNSDQNGTAFEGTNARFVARGST